MGDSKTTNGTHGTSGPNGATGPSQLRVAIIGSGIVGVAAALGLLRRNMAVRLYEQAGDFREIGAGVAFTTNAQACMALLSPAILAAMKAVSTKNESAYYTYVDGYRRGPGQTDDDADLSETQLYRLHAGTTGFDACHRAHFLDEMVKHVPEGMVEFGKRFDRYVFDEEREEYTLRFEDGTSATTDVGKLGISRNPRFSQCPPCLTPFITPRSNRLRRHQIPRPPSPPRRGQPRLLPDLRASGRLPRASQHGPGRGGARQGQGAQPVHAHGTGGAPAHLPCRAAHADERGRVCAGAGALDARAHGGAGDGG
jgi:hypothetical protein